MDRQLKENKKHGELDFPFTVYQCLIDSDFECCLHWHDEIEITLILEGETIHKINLDSFTLKEGDIVITPPKYLHSIKGIGDCKTLCFVFDINNLLVSINDKCYRNYFLPIVNGNYQIPSIISKNNTTYQEIKNSLININKLYHERNLAYELKIKSEIFNIFFLLFSKNFINKTKIENTHIIHKLKLAIEFIQNNYSENISINDIANSCFFNEFYFMKFFKKHMTITVNEYLSFYRLEKSIDYLLGTNDKITDIALNCGFNSSAYFIKIFKEKYKTTPTAYRSYYRDNK